MSKTNAQVALECATRLTAAVLSDPEGPVPKHDRPAWAKVVDNAERFLAWLEDHKE